MSETKGQSQPESQPEPKEEIEPESEQEQIEPTKPIVLDHQEKSESQLEKKSEKTGEEILRELLIRIPPKEEKKYIRDLEDNSEFADSDAPFSDFWYRVDKDADNFLQEGLNKKLLLDLGGGGGLIKRILREKGINVNTYINVDRFNFDLYAITRSKLNKETKQGFKFSEEKEEECNIIRVSTGMLDFLQYVGDESVDSITINGIDTNIIDNYNYHEKLSEEIKRVLKQGGIVFGTQGPLFNKDGYLICDKDFELEWNSDIFSAILKKKQKSKEK